jgi:hypothetical protein
MKIKPMSLLNLSSSSRSASSTPLCGSFKKIGDDHHENSAFANLSLLVDVAILQYEFDKQTETLPEIEKPRPRVKIIPPKKPLSFASIPNHNNPSGIDNLLLLSHAALRCECEFDSEKEPSMTMRTVKPLPRLKIIPPKKPKRMQDDEGKYQEPKPKRQRMININPNAIRQVGPNPPPYLPTKYRDKIINELHGLDLKLVIQKQLSETDMKSRFARLSLPKGQLRTEFLSQEDQTILRQRQLAKGNGCYRGLEVPLIEPQLVESSITVKKWKLGNSTSYTLGSQWQHVANDNGLKVGNIIQIWSFKVDQRPHLALVKLEL